MYWVPVVKSFTLKSHWLFLQYVLHFYYFVPSHLECMQWNYWPLLYLKTIPFFFLLFYFLERFPDVIKLKISLTEAKTTIKTWWSLKPILSSKPPKKNSLAVRKKIPCYRIDIKHHIPEVQWTFIFILYCLHYCISQGLPLSLSQQHYHILHSS